jgi:hypothetical protein
MKSFSVIWLVSLMWCAMSAEASVIKNGSFEMDGQIYITSQTRPEYWCDVSYDSSKFAMYTYNDWSADGNYSLTMETYMLSPFEPNDAATISQSMYLDEFSQLVFDLYLYSTGNWDTGIVTARVLIDNNEIWNSDGLQFDAGQFNGQVTIDINHDLQDGYPHLLSLQLSMDVSIMDFTQYLAKWDFIRFNYGCRGTLPCDFNADCFIDITDLDVFADGWLKPDGPDFTGDSINNFADFVVLANLWNTASDPSLAQPPQDNLLDADLNDDGIVDYGDIILLSNDWLGDGGPCVRADLGNDGIVNFEDFVKLGESWQQTGSLYGW